MLVDTHCHLNMMVKEKFDVLLKEEDFSKIEKIIEQSRSVGVDKVINVGTSVIESQNSINISKKFKNVFAAVGIHPCDCKDGWRREIQKIDTFLKNREKNKIVGVGETGLDFFHKPFNKRRQLDAFKFHIEFALKYSLPIVIHMRDATDEVLKMLENYKTYLTGVFHCFSAKKDVAKIVTDWEFYIGIDGHVTYKKNEHLREVVKSVPVDQLLLETDAPFLPPQQFRGKQNSPAYLPVFAQLVAELKNISLKDLAEITTKNASDLFAI